MASFMGEKRKEKKICGLRIFQDEKTIRGYPNY
jgi:hypothetical protein